MIPIEKTDLYRRLLDRVKIDYGPRINIANVYVDATFHTLKMIPFASIEEAGEKQFHINDAYCRHAVTKDAIKDIIRQCGITEKDLQFLKIATEFGQED